MPRPSMMENRTSRCSLGVIISTIRDSMSEYAREFAEDCPRREISKISQMILTPPGGDHDA